MIDSMRSRRVLLIGLSKDDAPSYSNMERWERIRTALRDDLSGTGIDDVKFVIGMNGAIVVGGYEFE
jgi:hypothetical protein